MDQPDVELIERWRSGDEQAAAALYQRYVERISQLVSGHLSAKLAQRLDADDVVQSVFRTVFRRSQAGSFTFEGDGDLWKLLATISLNKARSHARRNTSQKRDIGREAQLAEGDDLGNYMAMRLSDPPDIADAVAFNETLATLFDRLPDAEAVILQGRLEGRSQLEIAEQLGVTTRTVRRKLQMIQRTVGELFDAELSAGG